jgi:DNA-binding MarR family transcriptional regulator
MAITRERRTLAATEVPKSSSDNGRLARRPGFLIRRMHQIHLALFAEECAAFGITPVQFSIMTVADERPMLDQTELCAEVGVDRTTLANVVARLEAKGYLNRLESASDKRVRLISLTEAGRARLAKVGAPAQRAHDRTIAALPSADRALLLDLLMRLVDAQNEYGRAPLRLS